MYNSKADYLHCVMITIKSCTQSRDGAWRHRVWRRQLIENANTQSWWMRRGPRLHCVKRLSATLQEVRVGVGVLGGQGEMGGLVFLQRGNQTNWIWGEAELLGRACCLLRQWNAAGSRTIKCWSDDNRIKGKKNILELPHSVPSYIYLSISI